MAGPKQGVMTLSASAVALSTALSVDEGIQWLSLQPDGANANECYYGGSGVTTSTGHRMEAGATGVPPAPSIVELPEAGATAKPPRLSEWFLLGTASQKVRVIWIPA